MREANAKKSGMIQKWVLPSAGGCCWCVSIASPLSPIVSFELHCMTTTQQDTAVGRLLFPSLPPQLYVWRTYECQRSLRPSEDAEGIPQLSSTFVDRQTDCDNVTPSTRYCGLTSTSSYIYLDLHVETCRNSTRALRAQTPRHWKDRNQNNEISPHNLNTAQNVKRLCLVSFNPPSSPWCDMTCARRTCRIKGREKWS